MRICPVCRVHKAKLTLCEECGKAYEIANLDMTLVALIRWVAKRAWRFARKKHDRELIDLRNKIDRYESAMRNPPGDERHRGASVAMQLVHAQWMREKAERRKAEAERLLEELRWKVRSTKRDR